VRITWIQPEDLVRHELIQSAAEGRDVTAVAERWRAAGGLLGRPARGASPVRATEEQRTLARALLDELDVGREGGDPDEPETLDAVRATWAASPPQPSLDTATLADRIRGGWTGRAIGCLLGKPVEGMGREGIRAILKATGRWPLTDWFSAAGLPPEVSERHPWNRASRTTSLAENIDGMPEDDDLNYTMLALRILQRHGRGFTTEDVAQAWLSELPALRVFTAERVVYRNLLEGIEPERAALRHNPYREWIGALIRADLYGWASPGDPCAAAELAWRDARLSHVRNGLYGAIFVAAMTAAACVARDMDAVLDAGLSVVPPRSRLAAAVRHARDLAARGVPHESAIDELYARYGDEHWVHVLPNTAVIVLALAEHGGDFGRSICAAVVAGWDTDSVGATVGAVCGTLRGARAIPERWSAPLRDRVASSLPGFDGASFGDLAARTLALTGGFTRP